ncbi:MAG TPA: DUF1800 domain-containing protein [Phycisphaerales bacterium]|nr:DUF1800 domain-containing protein [Phycisphaerales bacterium]HMP37682.1 DUF1800 domain-containing protein [Phycisphaerales bacterium]
MIGPIGLPKRRSGSCAAPSEAMQRRTFLALLAAAGSMLAGSGCDRIAESIESLIDPDDRSPGPAVSWSPRSATIDQAAHLLNRITWGPRPGDRALLATPQAVEAFIDAQLEPESIDDRRVERRVAALESAQVPRAELYELPPALIAADLARERLLRAVMSRRQLSEIMADFWSDHLNIAITKGECRWMKLADDREVVRPHAMGRFRDLIRASLTSPAMLIALDGLDNKVSADASGAAESGFDPARQEERPNENHARELLELHTLGVDGGFDQRDVMEVARALSGWTFTHRWRRFFTARVAFDPARHDGGAKVVLGTVIPAGGGAEDVERLLDILCSHPSTARHIARRLCRVFIADPPPAAAVDAVADAFIANDGRIRPVLRALFATPAFREDPAVRGRLLKRPLRCVVSALRALEARTDCGAGLLGHLRRMGHEPFQHSTPEGYPLEAPPWLGTLLWRWNFAADLVRGAIPGTSIDRAALGRRFDFGTDPAAQERLIAHLLGRRPDADEMEHIGIPAAGAADSVDPIALVTALASPAFQWH